MMPNLLLAALRVGDDHRRLTQHPTLECKQHPVEQTEMRPTAGERWKRSAFALQPFPMDALPGSIDLLAECPIKALYDRQVGM